MREEDEVRESIVKFLTLELEFVETMRIETTTLGFTFNLSDSLKGNDLHFSNRQFSRTLCTLIHQLDKDRDYLFNDFESVVKGIMATWCFSEGKFELLKDGKRMIEDMVNCYFK